MIYRYLLLATCLLVFSFCKEDEPEPIEPEESALIDGGPGYELEYVRDGIIGDVPYIDSSGFILKVYDYSFPLSRFVRSSSGWAQEYVFPDVGEGARGYSVQDQMLIIDKNSSGYFKKSYWADLASYREIDLMENPLDTFISRNFRQTQSGFLVFNYEASPSRIIQFSWIENSTYQDVGVGFIDRATTPLSIIAAEVYEEVLYGIVVVDQQSDQIQLMKCKPDEECVLTPIFSSDRFLNIVEEPAKLGSFIDGDQFYFTFQTYETGQGSAQICASVNIDGDSPMLDVSETLIGFSSYSYFLRTNPLGVYYNQNYWEESSHSSVLFTA